MNQVILGMFILVAGILVGNNIPNGSESGIGSPIGSPVDFDKINELYNGPYNFSDIAVYVVRPSEVEFESPPEHTWVDRIWMKDTLKSVYYLRNQESLGDILTKFVEMARPEQTTTQVSGLGSTLVPSSTSNALTKNAQYLWGITPILQGQNKNVKTDKRPFDQEKALAWSNCGPRTGKFNTFSRKHVITVPENTPPEDLGRLTYLETLRRQIGEGIQSFTFFLKTSAELYDYIFYDLWDECYSLARFPAYTCRRFDLEDQIVGCFANGLCRPTYKKATGHMTQLFCDPGSALTMPDYRVSLEEMQLVQADFISQLIRAPPTHYDYKLNAWKARKWMAERRGEQFAENRPAYEKSEREQIWSYYENFLQSTDIPIEVKKLFYATPKLYFPSEREMRRDPTRPDCGVVSFHDLVLQVCPGHETPDLSVPPFNWGEVLLPVNQHFIGPEMEFPDRDEIWAELGIDIIRIVNGVRQEPAQDENN